MKEIINDRSFQLIRCDVGRRAKAFGTINSLFYKHILPVPVFFINSNLRSGDFRPHFLYIHLEVTLQIEIFDVSLTRL